MASPEEAISAYWGAPAGPSVSQPGAAGQVPSTAQLSALPAQDATAIANYFGVQAPPPPATPPPSPNAHAAPEGIPNPLRPRPPEAGPAPAPEQIAARSPSQIGPTPEEDAQFAAFTSRLTAPKPRPAGGGGGAPANPDPYGQKAAQQHLMGTFDQEMDAVRRGADAEAAKGVAVAGHRMELSRRMEEDALTARGEEEAAAKHFDVQMGELTRQVDEVRSKRIRPLSYMEAAGELGGLSIIGAAIGGFYQGLNRTAQNPFLAQLDKVIDRHMAAEEKNLDSQTQGLSMKMNLLGQQRQVFRDTTMAKAAARNLYYEAFKEGIAAEAANYDAPIYKANADKAVAEIERQQAALQKQIADQAAQRASAAAAQQYARAKEVQQAYRETYDKALSAGYAPAQAEYEAKRMVGIIYAPGTVGERPPEPEGGAFALGKSGREKIALDRHEAQTTSDEFNAQIDTMKKHPALEGLGITTGPLSSLGPRLAPGSTKTVQDLEQINTQIINAIGKVAKDAEGKPNVAMMERYEHRFTINPNDTKEIAMQKIEGAREVVNSLARQHGATGAPKPGAKFERDEALGAKPVR